RLKQSELYDPAAAWDSAPDRGPASRDPDESVLDLTDPLADLKARAQDALFARLGTRLFDASLKEQQLQAHVVQELSRIIDGEKIPLTPEERDGLVAAVTENVLGLGPIERYLTDPTVTEIMVNAQERIYVERAGKLH